MSDMDAVPVDLVELDTLRVAANVGTLEAGEPTDIDRFNIRGHDGDCLLAVYDGCAPWKWPPGALAEVAYIVAACNSNAALVNEARAGRRLAAVVADPGAAMRTIGWSALYIAAMERGAESLWDGGGVRVRSGAWEWVGEVDCRGDGPAESRALAAIAAIFGEPALAVLARLLP